MLAADDVIHLVGKACLMLMDAAILATVLGPAGHLRTEFDRDVTSHARKSAGLLPSPS